MKCGKLKESTLNFETVYEDRAKPRNLCRDGLLQDLPGHIVTSTRPSGNKDWNPVNISSIFLYPVTFHRQNLCHSLPSPNKQSFKTVIMIILRTSNKDIFEEHCRLVLNLYSLIQCTLPWVYMVYESISLTYVTTYYKYKFFIAYVAALFPVAVHSSGARARFMTALY